MSGDVVVLNRSKYNEFKIKTIERLSEESVLSLVGKRIHFTWHNINKHTKWTMPGKVLSLKSNKLRVFTMDIIFDEDEIDDDCNNMIEEIDLNEIIDVYEFSNYNPNFLDLHDYIHDDFHESAAYRITNIWNKSIECMIIDSDSISIRFICRNENNELINDEYPLYFISKIERIGVSQNEE